MATNTSTEDQRKRTMEALERRFATAKAEALQQVKHGKKRSLNDDEMETPATNSSHIASSPHVTDRSAANTPKSLSKKGNFTFSGYTAFQDLEESGLTYSQLPQSIHENLLTTNVEPSSRGSTVDNVLHGLFQNGDSAQKYLQGSRSMKIDNWILLDNYVQGRNVSPGSHIKALQIHSKRSRKHMSMKQLKRSGALDLPKDLQKKNQLAQCLLSADLHGANIIVAECKTSALTGLSGIMIRETTETFGMVTPDDKFHVVPKKVSVLMFRVDCWKITLLGDKLTSRNLGL
ncbi:POP4 domain-containing protein [Citrus sinensis]|nr:POP4 domain-containing protein [Citrus sinensis]